MSKPQAPVVACLALSLLADASAQPTCPPAVESGFGLPGADSDISAMALHNDGTTGGDRLYFGGSFGVFGDVASPCLVRSVGTEWEAFARPSGLASVRGMLGNADPASVPGAPLIVWTGVDTFTWDGQLWTKLINGTCRPSGQFAAMKHGAAATPTIYAGTSCSSGNIGALARLSGTSWVAIPQTLLADSAVWSLAPFNDGDGERLYVTGQLNVPGRGALRFARFDGTTWSTVQGNWPSEIRTVVTVREGPALVLFAIGGSDSAPSSRVWRRSAGGWTELAGGVPLAGATSLTSFNDGSGWKPYLAMEPGNGATPSVARWNGGAWETSISPALQQPGRGLEMNVVRAVAGLAGPGETLYAGGSFRGIETEVAHNILVKHATETWTPIHSSANGLSGSPVAAARMTHPQNGEHLLIIAGPSSAGGVIPLENVAVWNGAAWSGIDGARFFESTGVGTWGRKEKDEAFIVGRVRTESGQSQPAVIRWDGTAATPLPSVTYAGTSTRVFVRPGSFSAQPAMYFVGALAVEIAGRSAGPILAWDGTQWHDLTPSGLSLANDFWFSHTELEGDESSAIAISGVFPVNSGDPTIAVRSRGKWTRIGVLFPTNRVKATAWFDDGTGHGVELFVVGNLDSIDGIPVKDAAKWNGSRWEPVGTGFAGGAFGMTVVPGDSGQPSLLVWGNLLSSNAASIGAFATLSGGQWVPAGPDVRSFPLIPEITDVVPLGEGASGQSTLAAVGRFSGLGHGVSNNFAILSGLGERPALFANPQSPIRRATGQGLDIAINTLGLASSYQWTRSGVTLQDDGRVSGATSSTLRIAAVQEADAGTYVLHATGQCGTTDSIPLPVAVCIDVIVDGVLNVIDLQRFLGRFGQQVLAGTQGDFNADGVVNLVDLTRLIGAFGRTCPTN